MPLSDLIAKGKLSAYQRWEMSSFEDSDSRTAAARQRDLSQLRGEAQKEGFDKGFEEGYRAGFNSGAQDLQIELATIKQLGRQFSTSLQQAEQAISQEALELALDLAKAMLKNVLEIKPECIIPIVEEAVASLPSVQSPAQLFISSNDANLIHSRLGDELTGAGWIIMTDIHLQSGDCRIETNKNQVDGTMSTRWQRITEALGRDNKWIDQ